MELYYEASDGSVVNFMKNGIYAQDPENLTENTWEYTTISGVNGLAKIKRFYKNAQTYKLTLSIMADDREEFNEIMYNMHRTFERDVKLLQPGKIWWNDFYKEGFICSTSNSDYEELFESVEREIEFISVNPYWTRKTLKRYERKNELESMLDYPRDYGYDYDQSKIAEVLENECIIESNFEIIFYGPSVDPTVTIGGNIYALDITLKDGEYATINSTTKKIQQYSKNGEMTNIFDKRDRDNYIFKKIKEGTNLVTRLEDTKLDVILYDERGEPIWI